MSRVGNFDDMSADEKHGPFDFTVNGECSGCGECCSNLLPISSFEIKRIKRYVEKHKIPEQNVFAPVSGPTWDMTCPFRSEKERKCLIYEVRPEICRVFKCDQNREEIIRNKNVLNGKYYAVDMRSVFYGHEDKMLEMLEDMLNVRK